MRKTKLESTRIYNMKNDIYTFVLVNTVKHKFVHDPISALLN